MSGTYYIGIFLLIIILIKELLYIKDLKIATKKTTPEIIIIILGTIAIAIITNIFAKNLSHYILGFIAIITLIVGWIKQGICTNGILISGKSKELYEWSQIDIAKITLSNKVKVDYYTTSNSQIITQYYNQKHYDEILDYFEDNSVPIEIGD